MKPVSYRQGLTFACQMADGISPSLGPELANFSGDFYSGMPLPTPPTLSFPEFILVLLGPLEAFLASVLYQLSSQLVASLFQAFVLF